MDFRARVETGSQVFPNEASGAVGMALQWDTRDKINNTRRAASSRPTPTCGIS